MQGVGEQFTATRVWRGFVVVDASGRLVCWESGHLRLHLSEEAGQHCLRPGEHLEPVTLDMTQLQFQAAA